ncbi:MAG: DUF3868 domain-containing protein, partial [Muribaculaceae bacterium]|nr:DUF3868 domain-containing protein [Muribaculaceae bacterium]
MKKYTTAIRGAVCALTVLIGCQGAGAAAPESALQMRSISVERNADRMEIEFTIIPRDLRVDRDREVVFTPVIVSHDGDSTLELPVVKVSGRNRYYSHIRNGVAQGTKVYLAGSKEPIEYRAVVPYASWMERGRVDMLEATAHCCDAPVPAPTTPLARFDFVKEPLEPQFNYVDLTGDETIVLTAEGRAFLDFVVNRIDIRPTYRENTREIARIIETINLVKDDPDATITKVTFKGYASPEGPWDNNVRLAMGRTAALKEYVRQRYNFDPEIMSSDYEPEDWEGLRRWLLECDLPHRTEILQIVDSDLAPDPKDHEIRRRYPEEYAVILRDVYPALRHS